MNDDELDIDRRRNDRRGDFVPLAEYTVPELRKALITTFVLLAVLALFIYMVAPVIVAGIAGIVLGAYLLPFQLWLEQRTRRRTLAAILVILCVTIPLIALLAYSWLELSGAAKYLDAHRPEVVAGLNAGLRHLPFTEGLNAQQTLSELVEAASDQAGKIAKGLQKAASIVTIGVSVALFTIYYILVQRDEIVDYLRRKVPGRYRELTDQMSRNIKAVVYGALYGTFLTQAIKSVVVLLLNVAFDVPLAAVLAILSFFIGLFPIVGSWAVYLPVGLYLMLWRGGVWQGITVILVGFFGNTIFLSTYLRPKIAAQKSHVLNFYWMLIALITGVYTFGLMGIIIGPVLIAVLKAVFDTITGENVPAILGPRDAPLPPPPGI
ncbi:MAG TPA: AI-2E family transporter [Longimicrobiales bacterium]